MKNKLILFGSIISIFALILIGMNFLSISPVETTPAVSDCEWGKSIIHGDLTYYKHVKFRTKPIWSKTYSGNEGYAGYCAFCPSYVGNTTYYSETQYVGPAGSVYKLTKHTATNQCVVVDTTPHQHVIKRINADTILDKIDRTKNYRFYGLKFGNHYGLGYLGCVPGYPYSPEKTIQTKYCKISERKLYACDAEILGWKHVGGCECNVDSECPNGYKCVNFICIEKDSKITTTTTSITTTTTIENLEEQAEILNNSNLTTEEISKIVERYYNEDEQAKIIAYLTDNINQQAEILANMENGEKLAKNVAKIDKVNEYILLERIKKIKNDRQIQNWLMIGSIGMFIILVFIFLLKKK